MNHLAVHVITIITQLLASLLQKLQEDATSIQNESIQEVQASPDFGLARFFFALNHTNAWASQLFFIP